LRLIDFRCARARRIIYIGYVVSMAIFVATSVFEVFDAPSWIYFLDNYNLDKIIFATMLFSVFMIVYFVREQEKMKYQQHLEEQKRVKEGVWLAEQEIRNHIILINQATYIAEKKKDLSMRARSKPENSPRMTSLGSQIMTKSALVTDETVHRAGLVRKKPTSKRADLWLWLE
jgi:hypothetical protein